MRSVPTEFCWEMDWHESPDCTVYAVPVHEGEGATPVVLERFRSGKSSQTEKTHEVLVVVRIGVYE
jgi:hypothetical protein